jgi:hypothetical protein
MEPCVASSTHYAKIWMCLKIRKEYDITREASDVSVIKPQKVSSDRTSGDFRCRCPPPVSENVLTPGVRAPADIAGKVAIWKAPAGLRSISLHVQFRSPALHVYKGHALGF